MAKKDDKVVRTSKRDVDKMAAALRENLKRRKAQKNNQASKGKQDEEVSQKNS